jgi:hypothetical protein
MAPYQIGDYLLHGCHMCHMCQMVATHKHPLLLEFITDRSLKMKNQQQF